jgi:hypothetical protein
MVLDLRQHGWRQRLDIDAASINRRQLSADGNAGNPFPFL